MDIKQIITVIFNNPMVTGIGSRLAGDYISKRLRRGEQEFNLEIRKQSLEEDRQFRLSIEKQYKENKKWRDGWMLAGFWGCLAFSLCYLTKPNFTTRPEPYLLALNVVGIVKITHHYYSKDDTKVAKNKG